MVVSWKIAGLACIVFLLAYTISALTAGKVQMPGQLGKEISVADSSHVLNFLSVGDINLGREAGQRILGGDTLYPFQFVCDRFKQYDVVFGNLESPLSDQEGITQHPDNNLVFAGPPEGARSLAKAGISVVSTANNHALDFGVTSQRETQHYLSEAGVGYVGTAWQREDLWDPYVVTKNGIRCALFACTDVMNANGDWWKRYVASADTAKLLPAIRKHRALSDCIVISYHGGNEYDTSATRRTKEFARAVLHGGADLFLGHHPHVPYGLERIDGKYAVYSLGNFAFHQNSPEWTRTSYVFAAEIVKSAGGTQIAAVRVLPVHCDYQPRFVEDGIEQNLVLNHIRKMSSTMVEVKAGL